ncbi:pyrimidine reductase family protein [Corynebacterium sp. TAE3-ERU16]|uniref:pyrimidine reductase family protein n=1 Tax=Corynebacterium sp. TAE3-ERU16 TaxID=2849493 RepID=UPI001C493895|nr:pyrimidine reductase family protein [Corynebacterium sp. TAE3-ERU16]MBV7293326.1 pyrimidine reductase family protein [Corynebacterium sp. TAE3-ERU16]
MSDFPRTIPPEELIGPVEPVGHGQIRAVSAITLTGATAVSGTSGPLGNSTDAALLRALRTWSDVVLVGAETVRAENYGGVAVTSDARAGRTSDGRAPVPPIAVVTRSFNLSPDSRLFHDTEVTPIILAPASACAERGLSGARKAVTAAGGRIVSTGTGAPDEIVGCLRSAGYHRIVCEGGAQLLGQLVRAGLIDVHHITIDPSLTLPAHPPLIVDPDSGPGGTPQRHPLGLSGIQATSDGCVFLRYSGKHTDLTP